MNDFSIILSSYRKLSIPFPTARDAEIAYQVLRVDSEPKRNCVSKSLAVDNKILNVNFTGKEIRKIRVGLTSFFDSLTLVTETLKEFDSRELEYNYY